MRVARTIFHLLVIAMGMACSACIADPVFTPAPTQSPISGELTPYLTPTPSRTPTPLPPPTATPMPLPSATPLTHTVIKGEDMFGISLRYGITLDALRAANPDVDPDFLRVGAVLIIPEQGSTPGAEAGLPVPPPLDLPLTPPHCVQDATAGAWCFLQVTNDTNSRVQGISVRVSLLDAQGNTAVSRSAAAPLDLLLPGSAIPVAVHFPPSLPLPLQPSAQLLTAYPLPSDDSRFLDVRVENMLQQPRDGLSVDISGDLVLDGAEGAALVWVLAVAYDVDGNIVGIRRWESPAALAPGQSMPFILRLYSSGAEIDRVEVIPEAHRQ